VIACDFEFLTHQNQLYLKTRRPLLPPQQRRATHPQMAQHMLTGAWLKPSARPVELQRKTRTKPKKRKKGILNAPAAIYQIKGFISPHP